MENKTITDLTIAQMKYLLGVPMWKFIKPEILMDMIVERSNLQKEKKDRE